MSKQQPCTSFLGTKKSHLAKCGSTGDRGVMTVMLQEHGLHFQYTVSKTVVSCKTVVSYHRNMGQVVYNERSPSDASKCRH